MQPIEIRIIRMERQPLVNKEDAKSGMDYLLSVQDLKFIENLFQNNQGENSERSVAPDAE